MINVEEYKGNFKDASYDSIHGESLIEDQSQQVYILDEIAKKIASALEIDTPSSCDSVVVRDEDIYLIEFKNRDYKDITSKDKREIRKKAYQSQELILSTFLKDKTIQYVAEHVQLFVVFKSMESSPESFGKISETLNRLANGDTPEIKCKLAKFEGTFYKTVRTVSKDDFEKIYMPQIFS